MDEEKRLYYSAVDIEKLLGISRNYAYKLIRELNIELKDQGYIVIAGKIPKRYFCEKYYGLR